MIMIRSLKGVKIKKKRRHRMAFEDKFRLDDQTMALRVAKEFEDGMMVNLGIGVPCLAANMISTDKEVLFHAENGCMGFGQICTAGEGDPDIVNAGGQPVEPRPGMCFLEHSDSFAIIRSGRLDYTVLGGLQVSEKGDLANWMVPKKKIGTIGGAMDLALCAKKTIVVMTHVTKDNQFKIVKECSYPLTAPRSVHLVITDIAVMEITKEGVLLKEMAPGWEPEEIQELTEPKLIISPDIKDVELV
jgi:acetate CoA/acetoacetate CoA-transferase beta subunit